jgi:hypothetical protein
MEENTLVLFELPLAQTKGVAKLRRREEQVLVIKHGKQKTEHPARGGTHGARRLFEVAVLTPARGFKRGLGIVPRRSAASPRVAPLTIQERGRLGSQGRVPDANSVIESIEPTYRAVRLLRAHQAMQSKSAQRDWRLPETLARRRGGHFRHGTPAGTFNGVLGFPQRFHNRDKFLLLVEPLLRVSRAKEGPQIGLRLRRVKHGELQGSPEGIVISLSRRVRVA